MGSTLGPPPHVLTGSTPATAQTSPTANATRPVVVLGTLTASREDEMLGGMIDDVRRDLPFDVSPRNVRFRSTPALEAGIDRYVLESQQSGIVVIESRLRAEHSAYVGIFLLYVLHRFPQDSARSALGRYRDYIKNHGLFTTDLPGPRDVADAAAD